MWAIVRSTAFAALLGIGLAAGMTPAPSAPAPVHRFTVDRATPAESLAHDIRHEFEMDAIRAGRRAVSARKAHMQRLALRSAQMRAA